MKTILIFICLMALGVSCGKKSEQNDSSQARSFDSSFYQQILFNSQRDFTRAIEGNNLNFASQIYADHPDLDLNYILIHGESYLTHVIKNDQREMRNFLIEKGAKLEVVNLLGETPLLSAVSSNRINSVKVLVDYQVNLEAKNNRGETALHVALRKRFDDIAFILVQAQANLNATNKLNQTARYLLVEQYHPRTMALVKSMAEIESGAPDLVTFKKVLVGADYQHLDSILNRYPSIASEDAYQSLNPLSLLVTSKSEVNGLKAAHLLLKHESPVDGPIDAEFSPLIMATLNEKKAFAELYLGHYANTERLDRDGKSALIHAIEINNSELVKLLLSYSALEKYSFRKNGKKITFSSCEVAKKVERKLKTKEEILENQKIKNSLKCQKLWLF